jgi:hypothetical protein
MLGHIVVIDAWSYGGEKAGLVRDHLIRHLHPIAALNHHKARL